MDYHFKSSFSYNPFQNALSSLGLEEGRGAEQQALGSRSPAANTSSLPCTSSPHYYCFFVRVGSIFLNPVFSKAGNREDLILGVMLKGRVEGELVHMALSIQPCNPTVIPQKLQRGARDITGSKFLWNLKPSQLNGELQEVTSPSSFGC